VTDLFAVLGLPRSPWLDAEELKQRHHAMMADEASANSSPTILNEARRTLQNPALRIRHFLALEFPDHQHFVLHF
jgi:DnaJ-domain-containing protein 1